MKFVFRNDTVCNRIELLVSDTWMCWRRGEGEEEIANHGRSRVKSFSQETEAIGQQTPMIGEHEPKLHSKSQVQDAHDSPTLTPLFSLSSKYIVALELGWALQRVLLSDSPRACRFLLASTDVGFFSSDYYGRIFLALRNSLGLSAEPIPVPATKFLA